MMFFVPSAINVLIASTADLKMLKPGNFRSETRERKGLVWSSVELLLRLMISQETLRCVNIRNGNVTFVHPQFKRIILKLQL